MFNVNDLLNKVLINSPRIRNSVNILNSFEKSQTNELEKSIVDSLSYNDGVKIEKTGKEIKEQIASIRAEIEAQKNVSIIQMAEYRKLISIEPDEAPSDYDLEQLGRNVSNLPNCYSWEQRCGDKKISDSNTISYPKQEITVAEDQKLAMNNYNKTYRTYLKCFGDLAVVDTMTRNLPDSKKITLSIKQATMLGF